MQQLSLEFEVISHRSDTSLIDQRKSDGYVNATAMCRATYKQFNDYARLLTTQEFVKELSSETGIPVSALIQSVKGGNPKLQGTWVHPQVAINLGQWCSPAFAVKVSQWVFDWMTGKYSNPVTKVVHSPVFVQRFHDNSDRTASGYFSVISELFIRLHGRFERAGYVIPDKARDGREIRPDGSVGKLFKNFLNLHYPQYANCYTTYEHIFPNGYVCEAKQYLNELLPLFIWYVENIWIKEHAQRYFQERDIAALDYLPKLLK